MRAVMLDDFVKWVHRREEPIRVGIAAAIGTVLAWATYEIIYFLNAIEPRATTSWAIAFVIGIFRQHHLHRRLSFPDTRVSYLTSLRRDALASLMVIVATSGLNFILTQHAGLHHRIAWAACLVSVAAFDYAMMKFFVFRRFRAQRGRR